MRITVVGDTLLDVDITGTVERQSPDGPVPVVDVQRTRSRPGGAGLAARMLADDGHDVHLVTALSRDEHAASLHAMLRGITVVAGALGGPTPVKTRLRAAGQTIARMDEGCDIPTVPQITEQMLAAVLRADVILVADYGRGLAADASIRTALQQRAATVPLIWDPHRQGPDPVPNTAVVTPNLDEALVLAGLGPDADAADGVRARSVSSDLASELLRRWPTHAVAVTLGAHGALIAGDSVRPPRLVPADPVDTADPCGAGDRFAASLAVELARGLDLLAAVREATEAAGEFLRRGGVATIAASTNTAGERLTLGRVPGNADAHSVVQRVREQGGTVVATGGCFDLLHAGHTRTLSAARQLGDCLVVCLNSDASVARLKGEGRPIIVQDDRVDLLLALECVDAVIVFDEDTPEQVLRGLRPDIWVKGGDYTVDELPEAQVMRGWGGRTVTVPYYPARSTTTLASALALVG